MMQYAFFLAHPEGQSSFVAEKLRHAIGSLKGIANWRERADTVFGESVLFRCELARTNEVDVPVPIIVSRDLLSFSVGAYCDVGLDAALEIQRRYGDEIYACSEESSPEVVRLSPIATAKELAEKLRLRE